MKPFAQSSPDSLEAGGFLLGRYLERGVDLVVDFVTVPQPNDIRARTEFFRSNDRTIIKDSSTNPGKLPTVPKFI